MKIVNEELSTDKEAFLVLDKLAQDLKKIYDEDGEGYKIHEQERMNKAVNDLIELEIDYVIIKEIIHFVAQNVYERKYTQEDLLKKLEKMKFKYRNVIKTDNEDSKKEESLKTESVSSSTELSDILQKLKDHDYLKFDTLYQTHDGTVSISYNSENWDEDGNFGQVNSEELKRKYDTDLNNLKNKYNATIDEEGTGFNEDTGDYMISIYYENKEGENKMLKIVKENNHDIFRKLSDTITNVLDEAESAFRNDQLSAEEFEELLQGAVGYIREFADERGIFLESKKSEKLKELKEDVSFGDEDYSEEELEFWIEEARERLQVMGEDEEEIWNWIVEETDNHYLADDVISSL